MKFLAEGGRGHAVLGRMGKRANCQAGRWVTPATRATPCGLHLTCPTRWVDESICPERRRGNAGCPPTSRFKTQPTLGREMIQAVQQAGTVRWRWVTGDAGLWARYRLPRSGGRRWGWWYFAEVPHATQVWRQRPAPRFPPGGRAQTAFSPAWSGVPAPSRIGPSSRLTARGPGFAADVHDAMKAAGPWSDDHFPGPLAAFLVRSGWS